MPDYDSTSIAMVLDRPENFNKPPIPAPPKILHFSGKEDIIKGDGSYLYSFKKGLEIMPFSFPYKFVFEPEAEGGYHAYCPSIPGCHSQGDNLEEAAKNIQEAIIGILKTLKEKGWPIPKPDIEI